MKKVVKVLSLIVIAIFMIMLVGCDNDMAKTNTATDIQDLEVEIKLEDLGFKREEINSTNYGVIATIYIGDIFSANLTNMIFEGKYDNSEYRELILDNITLKDKVVTFTYTDDNGNSKIEKYDYSPYWILYTNNIDKIDNLDSKYQTYDSLEVIGGEEKKAHKRFHEGKLYTTDNYYVVDLDYHDFRICQYAIISKAWEINLQSLEN